MKLNINQLLLFLPILTWCQIGQIKIFDSECPQGWKLYSPASGRMIIGTGFYSGSNNNGEYQIKNYLLNQTGGTITHVLKIQQMPKHTHQNGEFRHLLRQTCYFTRIAADSSCGQPDIANSAPMLSVGGNLPHNNMPPFIALKFCKQQKIIKEGSKQDLNSNYVIMVLCIVAITISFVSIVTVIYFCWRNRKQMMPQSRIEEGSVNDEGRARRERENVLLRRARREIENV